MYRSASTLQFQITSRLVAEFNRGQQIGWIDAQRFAEVRDRYGDRPGLQVIKVHRCTAAIAAEFTQGRAIGIYSFRDIRDVYASYMKQRRKSFDYFWQMGLIESCLDNYKAWTGLPRVLVSAYEAIVDDIPAEVQRIARQLAIDLAPGESQRIAADYSLTRQGDRIQAFRTQLMEQEHNPDDHRDWVDYHDEASLLHINHIDSGQTGRWIHDLSPQQADWITESVKHWCAQNHTSPSLFLSTQLQPSV